LFFMLLYIVSKFGQSRFVLFGLVLGLIGV